VPTSTKKGREPFRTLAQELLAQPQEGLSFVSPAASPPSSSVEPHTEQISFACFHAVRGCNWSHDSTVSSSKYQRSRLTEGLLVPNHRNGF